MPTPNEEAAPSPLSKEETAYLMRILWKALISPKWDKSNRRDLEKLGEAIYSGKTLKELDDALYDRIAPHLAKVATDLGLSLREGVPAHDGAPPESRSKTNNPAPVET